MRELLPYIKNYKKETIIAPLFKMLEASFELLIPLIMANIIDIGIRKADQGYIWKMCLVMIGLGFLGLVCSLIAQYFSATGAAGFGTELRRDFYAHINALSYQELDTIGTSTLITRITSDINQIQSGFNLLLRLLLRAPFIVSGAIIMAFTISAKLTLIFLVAAPLLALAIFLMVKFSVPIYKNVQKALDKVITETRGNYTGARVIRAFARQHTEQDDFYETTKELKIRQIKAGKIAGLMNPITYLLVNLAIVVILWFGGEQVNIGGITQGELIALISYMTQVLMALLALAFLVMSVTKAVASTARVNEVMAIKPVVTASDADKNQCVGARSHQSDNNALIQFTNVDFCYANAKEMALSDIDFSVKAGEVIGIIGGTGSGKTTLVNLIPRFYEASAGRITIAGNDIKNYPFVQLREKIGVVPQRAVLFAGTIRDNMRWGNEGASDEEIYKALSIAQAKAVVDEKEDGLDTLVLAGGQNFSGGQRQRLTIARALVKNPEILILDDSSSALDYATDATLRKALKEQTNGMTVLVVSQRAVTVKASDRILVLDDGAIVGNGTHEELYKDCDVYKEICLSQGVNEEEQL